MNITIDVIDSVYESICRYPNILSVVDWSEVKFIFNRIYLQSNNNMHHKNMCVPYTQDKWFPNKEGNVFILKKVMNDMRYVLIHGSKTSFTNNTGLLNNAKAAQYDEAQALLNHSNTVVCVNYKAHMDEYTYSDAFVIRDEFIPDGIGIVVHRPSIIPVIPIHQGYYDYGWEYPHMDMGFQINNSERHCVFSVPC